MRTALVFMALLALSACDLTVQAGAKDSGLTGVDAGAPECLPGLTKYDWFLVKQSIQSVLADALDIAETSARPQTGSKRLYGGALWAPSAEGDFEGSAAILQESFAPLCNATIFCSDPRSPLTAVRFASRPLAKRPAERWCRSR